MTNDITSSSEQLEEYKLAGAAGHEEKMVDPANINVANTDHDVGQSSLSKPEHQPAYLCVSHRVSY